MAYELTIGGYTFDNPPERYRKSITLGNSPVPHQNRNLASFYQSDRQELQVEVEGRLSLNEQNDLDELEELQALAIQGGEVEVDFDPFFSGDCIMEDNPFRQSEELGTYRFILTVNEDTTDTSAYPSHATPTTGNTFTLGSYDFGYDPESIEENYERETTTVDRLQGISQSVDLKGLVTKVSIDGNTDGGGLVALWDKARSNELSYLDAEFQEGWALIVDFSVSNNRDAPDYLKGLFNYNLELFVVSDPASGIGGVSSYIDHDVKDTGTYVGDSGSGDSDFSGLEFTVSGGTGSINGDYVAWDETTLTLTDNATNYVYITDTDSDGAGDVLYNTSSFPADGIEMYEVVTSGGDIITITDIRAQLINDNDSSAGDGDGETEGGDIYFTVAGGSSPDDPNGQETTWNQTTHKLATNSTNYLFVEDPNSDGDGQVAINQSGYPSNTVSLWRVETDADSITNEIDDRPDDLNEGGSGDTSDSDLTFSDSVVVDDTQFSILEALVLTDTVSVSGATLPWLGIASLSDETVDVADGPLTPALGIATLSEETVAVSDGGTASSGTSAVELTTDVTLNGETVDVTVYEDTTGDGTVDNQETVSGVADGQNSYTLTNLSGGTGNDYWVEPSLSTSDKTVSPLVNSISLNTAGSGGDTDQNTNTEWKISPGLYDTSGNEYEGGGSVVTYE